tara:strand:+ start:1986 stop:2876 length:891 start_codon:yes stop_codon:yes gene_type:complete
MSKGKIYLATCFGLDFDLCLLDHFISHYRSLGIHPDNFLIVLNVFKNFENLELALKILKKHEVVPSDIWCQEYESQEKWSRVHYVISKRAGPEDWVVHPDSDEFFQFPMGLSDMLSRMDASGINAAQGFLVDRLSEDGKIKPVVDDLSIFDQFPSRANFSNLIGLTGVKLMAYKGNLRANNGSGQIHPQCAESVSYLHGGKESLHKTELSRRILGEWSSEKDIPYDPEKFNESVYQTLVMRYGLIVHHFKWHGTVIEKLRQRVETYRRLGRPQLRQSQRLLDHYDKNGKFIFSENI